MSNSEISSLRAELLATALDEQESLRRLAEHAKALLRCEPVSLRFIFPPSNRASTAGRLVVRWSTRPDEIGMLVPKDMCYEKAVVSPSAYTECSKVVGLGENEVYFAPILIPLRTGPEEEPVAVLAVTADSPAAPDEAGLQETARIMRSAVPYLAALTRARVRAQQDRLSRNHAISSYLDRLAGLYGHKFASRTDALKFSFNVLEAYLKRGALSDARSLLREMEESFLWIEEALEDLWQEIAGFYSVGVVLISRLVDELTAEERKITERFLEIDRSVKEVPPVRASRLLKEHLRNLLLNAAASIARKMEVAGTGFTPRISIRAHLLSGRRQEQAGSREQRVRLTFHDNGIGVPAERLKDIFVPGFSSWTSTGLGLSAARQYARELDGDVWAESLEGEWFTVHMELPIAWWDERGKE